MESNKNNKLSATSMYEHYIESQKFGPGALILGLASYISIQKEDGTHRGYWTERRANRNAAEYFGKYYGIVWSGYSFTYYPLN